MSDQQACGKGIAERSALPSKLAELTAALADVLAFHQTSLQLDDYTGRNELRAYLHVEEQLRLISSLLKTTAHDMAAYRNLAMAGHDIATLMSEENRDRFATFVRLEGELIDLLSRKLEEDEDMLRQMNAGAQE
jgi:hypothetical protein